MRGVIGYRDTIAVLSLVVVTLLRKLVRIRHQLSYGVTNNQTYNLGHTRVYCEICLLELRAMLALGILQDLPRFQQSLTVGWLRFLTKSMAKGYPFQVPELLLRRECHNIPKGHDHSNSSSVMQATHILAQLQLGRISR